VKEKAKDDKAAKDTSDKSTTTAKDKKDAKKETEKSGA